MKSNAWMIASEQQVNNFIEQDFCSCIYGWATPLRNSSTAWLYLSRFLAILSSSTEMYPDLPPILQLYPPPGQRSCTLINIDEIPNLPQPLLVYTTSKVIVQSDHYQIVESQKYQRFRLAKLQGKSDSQFNIRQVNSNDYGEVIRLYQSTNTLRFHPKFLNWGLFSGCWDSFGVCIGAYGTHVYPKNNYACLVGHLYVAEKWRGYGIGTALVVHLSSLLIKQFSQLFCDIELDNHASIKIHKRVGYHQTDTVMQMLFCF